jgi:signal peptidase I
MNSEENKSKPRNPILVFFLAFLFSGFGQVYNGQIKKGLIFLLITFIIPFILGFTRIGVFFHGFLTVIIIDLSFRIYVIYDAVKNAKKLKNYKLKSYNTWYYYLIIFIGIIIITCFYDYNSAVGVKSYKIPTSSNEPTLNVGDKVVGDLRAFNDIKPNYGDIVVFQKKDSLNPWVYRIVALPNDKLAIKNNFLIINGKKCKTSFIKETKSDEFDVNEYEEVLPNGHKHKIYTFKNLFDDNKNAVNEIIIPANCYYLIGDNRDYAMDSRYIGVIEREEIIAKVVFGYWGKTNDRININFRDK